MLSFSDIWLKAVKPENRFQGTMLSLDPGHTTGYAFWRVGEKPEIIHSGQIKTWENDDLEFKRLQGVIEGADKVVFESYQVYDWKKDEHSWSQIPTVQVIGCIKTLCKQLDIEYFTQTAQVAKQFCTDDKLEKWGMWKKGERHARDAIRHGCYWLLFR